jgi:hypothetical protein
MKFGLATLAFLGFVSMGEGALMGMVDNLLGGNLFNIQSSPPPSPFFNSYKQAEISDVKNDAMGVAVNIDNVDQSTIFINIP